ncbi:hypothetical protein [Cryobacterium sp. Y62]|uniref:hypothetical protein n=1 Tax=Cryobacterium sp. Y62 TaxID=2048284 RepID=UPI0011AFFC0F|nr:hypothetical protein [Cryobacterium sp. Y62]
MHGLVRDIGIIATTGVPLDLALSPAYAADSDTVDATISAGLLTFEASAPNAMTAVMHDGSSSESSTGTTPQWKVVNARGTAAAPTRS